MTDIRDWVLGLLGVWLGGGVGEQPARFKTSTFSQTMVLLNRFWITLM